MHLYCNLEDDTDTAIIITLMWLLYRLCQELNHIPLRCNEVEKKTETDMRVYIENMISEAVMRKCHRCGKRFVKEDGCNKMTCVCGATSCYACKEFDIDYDHFNNNQR